MSYLTRELLEARVGGDEIFMQLTDDDGDQEPDANVLVLLLGHVDSLVEGYARRGEYTVPLAASDSALLLPYMLDISNYKAKSRRGMASKEDWQLYRDALALLGMLADGTFILPSATVGATGSISLFGLDSEDQIFSRFLLRDL